MVNSHSQLEDDDLEGSHLGDDYPSEDDLPPGQGDREVALQKTGLVTTSDEDDDSGDGDGDDNQGVDEQRSPPRAPSHHSSQDYRTEAGPPPGVPLGTVPGPSTSRAQEGETLLPDGRVSCGEHQES